MGVEINKKTAKPDKGDASLRKKVWVTRPFASRDPKVLPNIALLFWADTGVPEIPASSLRG